MLLWRLQLPVLIKCTLAGLSSLLPHAPVPGAPRSVSELREPWWRPLCRGQRSEHNLAGLNLFLFLWGFFSSVWSLPVTFQLPRWLSILPLALCCSLMSCEGGCEHTGGASVHLSTWLPQNHPPDSIRSKIWTDVSVGAHQQKVLNHHRVPNTWSLPWDPLEGQNETSYHLNYDWVRAQTGTQRPMMLWGFFSVVFRRHFCFQQLRYSKLMSSDRVVVLTNHHQNFTNQHHQLWFSALWLKGAKNGGGGKLLKKCFLKLL